jgi:hypothetical protein
MARLYANENFPFPVVAELRQLGHLVNQLPTTHQLFLVCQLNHLYLATRR